MASFIRRLQTSGHSELLQLQLPAGRRPDIFRGLDRRATRVRLSDAPSVGSPSVHSPVSLYVCLSLPPFQYLLSYCVLSPPPPLPTFLVLCSESVSLSVLLSHCLSVCLSVPLSVCLSVSDHLPLCLPVCPSVSVLLSLCLPVCPSVSVPLSASLSLCLSVSLCVSSHSPADRTSCSQHRNSPYFLPLSVPSQWSNHSCYSFT